MEGHRTDEPFSPSLSSQRWFQHVHCYRITLRYTHCDIEVLEGYENTVSNDLSDTWAAASISTHTSVWRLLLLRPIDWTERTRDALVRWVSPGNILWNTHPYQVISPFQNRESLVGWANELAKDIIVCPRIHNGGAVVGRTPVGGCLIGRTVQSRNGQTWKSREARSHGPAKREDPNDLNEEQPCLYHRALSLLLQHSSVFSQHRYHTDE
jgi:hypothetical protein